jgi:fructoselysine-6-P-deglycase FrlB-like protein
MRETGYAHVYVVGTGTSEDGVAPAKAVAHMEFKNADPGGGCTSLIQLKYSLKAPPGFNP